MTPEAKAKRKFREKLRILCKELKLKLWLQGPDDVVAAPSLETAQIVARNFNAIWDEHRHERNHDVHVVAEVIEWTHGCIEHAKSVVAYWPEYAELLDDAAIAKDSSHD